MEMFSLSKQFKQEIDEKPVQTGEKQRRKGRSPEEKMGRIRWNQILLKRALSEIEQVRVIQRIILNGLKGAGYFHFDVPMIQKITCVDAVDLNILEVVRESGAKGVFPKDVAKEINAIDAYDLKYYDVSRRIVRMNKRLARETGEVLFEKRGHKWALTTFAFDLYGASSLEDVRSNSADAKK